MWSFIEGILNDVMDNVFNNIFIVNVEVDFIL